MSPPAKFLVAAAMRNEGAFLLEWVCWYRMLGFDVLVVTNDCTDHSPQLLGTLQDAGWISHAEHVPKEWQQPKRSAHAKIRNHPAVAETDWLLIVDVDEFLVLHEHDNIADYVAHFDPPPLGFGFHWKIFGTDGHDDWHDTLLHRTFHAAAHQNDPANVCFKSMFRRPLDFAKFGAHSPRDYSGPWGVGNHVWVDGRGKRLARFTPDKAPQKATAPDRVRHELAQMNHYILRFRESFELKRGTPSASSGIDRYNQAFWDRFERSEEDDRSALRFADAFDAVHAQAMALPDVQRLHHLCCADYAARLAEARGEAPQDDLRYLLHRELAGAAQ